MALTRSGLAADLRRLGVREGGMLMVHTRMSALGWVVGAAETVVLELLDAVGPHGTLAAYTSWEEHVYRPEEWPAEHRDAYLTEPPVFDRRRAGRGDRRPRPRGGRRLPPLPGRRAHLVRHRLARGALRRFGAQMTSPWRTVFSVTTCGSTKCRR